MNIAVIGSGISGLTAARKLSADHTVALFERESRLGGHTHTVTVPYEGREWHIDTGFIVFNHRNYPRFTALLRELDVPTLPTTMSLGVCSDADGIEYCGSSLSQLFAQRRNLASPRFYGMLRDIIRFHKAADAFLAKPDPKESMLNFVGHLRLGKAFREWYLVPIMAAIWSTEPARTLSFPALFILRFLRNHGMTQVKGRPQWHVLRGGSSQYLAPISASFRDRIHLHTPVDGISRTSRGAELYSGGRKIGFFDAVVIATHSDTALKLLGDQATSAEREVLGAIPYQQNDVVLHNDTSILPRSRRAWAAWNYRVGTEATKPPIVTYNMNELQRLEAPTTFCVTLNSDAIAPEAVFARFRYDHPLFTSQAVAAQARHREINGQNRLYFCGAYWGNGFHEDGVVSGETAAAHLEADHPRGIAV
ncbi:MAG TPA: FAD-dependent oxidoreductase [Lentisphaeria bacterium]|nr:FAD-dependent oxidoreductase [Lentisphaeria bacterium]